MPYTITRYQLTADPDARFPLNLLDNTLDNTSTSLNLLGRGVRNYGTATAQNFVWLTENFAGPTSPGNPIVGQLWWDTAAKLLKVYRGSGVWRGVAYDRQTTAPASPQAGDMWYNSTTNVLNYYNGTLWVQLNSTVSGTIPVTVDGNQILEFITDGEIVAILSRVTFTPTTPITGFPVIHRGFTLTNVAPTAEYFGQGIFV